MTKFIIFTNKLVSIQTNFFSGKNLTENDLRNTKTKPNPNKYTPSEIETEALKQLLSTLKEKDAKNRIETMKE